MGTRRSHATDLPRTRARENKGTNGLLDGTHHIGAAHQSVYTVAAWKQGERTGPDSAVAAEQACRHM